MPGGKRGIRMRSTKSSWLLGVVLILLSPLCAATQIPVSVADKEPALLQISGVENAGGVLTGSGVRGPATVSLNDELLVKLIAGNPGVTVRTPDASRYVLFLNGHALNGIPAAVYHHSCQCLGFDLRRSADNRGLWASLLGSPVHLAVPVSVSLGMRVPGASVVQPSIFGVNREASIFYLGVISPWRLTIAIAAIAAMLVFVWGRSRRSTTLRDGYLPQIAPEKQTYSLARWQMAFWFTLIFASFLFLFLLLWDFNTISLQALALLGISGGTAAGAIAVDVARDSPADAVNRGLQALGLYTYADVLRVRDEIRGREMELKAVMAAESPAPQTIMRLQTEIQDRMNILRTHQDKTGPFETQGWFKDITTDINGTSLHRLQAILWTCVLGAVFLVGVYRDLDMPQFSVALLALMGISNAGYVGFKMQEQNS